MSKKTRIYMGIPSTGTRHDSQTYALREIEARYKDHVELVYPDLCIHRTFHDFARNSIVEEFLASDCDILWFLDSDIVPPKHILDLVALHGDKWQAAGAVYPIWMTPPGGAETCILFTGYKELVDNSAERGFRMSEVPRGGTDWLDAIATGCMFLKRDIFSKLEKPYFQFKYDPQSMQLKEGEDLGFCLKLSKLNIKFFTDYSMVCKHYKTVCLLDMNNYSTSWSNFKVLEYDKEIRSQVQSAVIAAERAGYERGLKEARRSGPMQTKSGLIIPG